MSLMREYTSRSSRTQTMRAGEKKMWAKREMKLLLLLEFPRQHGPFARKKPLYLE